MSEKENEVFAELIVSGFLMPHHEFTSKLGITPSEAFNKGDDVSFKNNRGTFTAKHNEWVLKSSLNEYTSISQHLKFLIAMIKPKKDKFLLITINADLKINIIINADPNFGQHFEIELLILKELAELNIKLVFDIYNIL